MLDSIPEPNPGESILEWARRITERANRRITGENYIEDSRGTTILGGEAEDKPDRHFELKDNLSSGSNATAYLRTWNGSTWETDTAIEFEVYDALDTFSGIARDEGPPIVAGNWGYAEWFSAPGRWEIIQLSCAPGGGS